MSLSDDVFDLIMNDHNDYKFLLAACQKGRLFFELRRVIYRLNSRLHEERQSSKVRAFYDLLINHLSGVDEYELYNFLYNRFYEILYGRESEKEEKA